MPTISAPAFKAVTNSAPVAPAAKHKISPNTVEDVVNLGGTMLSTAAVSALSASLAPIDGSGFRFLVGSAAFAVGAGVTGGIAGIYTGEKIGNFASRVAGTTHSADERIINPIMGFVTNGIAGLAGSAASSYLGVSPVTAALVAGGTVLGIGALVGIVSHFNNK